MPFEDVAIGLLAERCSMPPRNAENEKLVSNFRTPFDEEKKAVEESRSLGIDTLTSPDMDGKICQVCVNFCRKMIELVPSSYFCTSFAQPHYPTSTISSIEFLTFWICISTMSASKILQIISMIVVVGGSAETTGT